ncbi:MAG: ATP-dependent DNA helicase [Halobacteriaceae archaeon]
MAPSSAPGYERFFPYEPYENQRAAMEAIGEALAAGRDTLFEGACGTGKTLAALAPALAFARETDRTVVITTNVHQQMRQFVDDARAITRQERIRAVVFRGKASMCHVDVGYEECQVLRDNTRELVEAEAEAAELERRAEDLLASAREGDDDAAEARSAVMDELDAVRDDLGGLRERNTCEHYYNNLRAGEAFTEWLYDGVRTPDDIYEWAEERTLCGYELLKEAMEGVELVICNYHHLLDPTIRTQFFRWLGRDPGEVIAVFDEAHNVPDAARDHAARTLAGRTLDSALAELADCDDPRAAQAANVLEPFRDALVAAYEGTPEARQAGEEWTDVPVANAEGRDDLTRAFLAAYEGAGVEADLEAALALGRDLDEEYERAYKRGETTTRKDCPTLTAAGFVAAYVEEGDDPARYPVVGVREGADGLAGRAELYTTIPSAVTADLFDSVYASVLMSATLRPFDVTADVLGLEDPRELAFGLEFPEANRRTLAVDTPPLFASEREDPAVQSAVADALRDAVAYTAGSALLFFPSYAEAERYHGLLSEVGATRYLDRPGERAEELRRRFVADDDAALFTSLWGTLSEGVSFDGDAARAAAVVGVPYPRLDDRLEAVQAAYDRAFEGEDAGWRYAVEIPTVRKTRQALGRVLRSPEEVGVRLLLDRRYTAASREGMGDYSVHDTFPEEEREEIVDVQPEKLRYALLNFFGEHGCYEGEPPAP